MIPKEMLKFAEGIMRLKAVVDETAAIEAHAAKARADHDAAIASYDKEIDAYVEKVQDAQALHEKAVAELDKRHAEYEAAKAQLESAYAEAKSKHDKQLAALHSQAQSTIQSLTYEKAQAMRSLQDAKTLHAAEMEAMGAERAKMESDLAKLREVRHKLLVSLQTGA